MSNIPKMGHLPIPVWPWQVPVPTLGLRQVPQPDLKSRTATWGSPLDSRKKMVPDQQTRPGDVNSLQATSHGPNRNSGFTQLRNGGFFHTYVNVYQIYKPFAVCRKPQWRLAGFHSPLAGRGLLQDYPSQNVWNVGSCLGCNSWYGSERKGWKLVDPKMESSGILCRQIPIILTWVDFRSPRSWLTAPRIICYSNGTQNSWHLKIIRKKIEASQLKCGTQSISLKVFTWSNSPLTGPTCPK